MKRRPGKQAIALTSPGPGTPDSENINPTHEEIARLAYAYWQERAGHGGSPEEDCYRAKQEILRRMKTVE